jgi:predicted RNA binding protein YcfA (HicA-like mRNA interferase family)
MRYKELTKKLKRLGCEYARQAAGSHEVWKNPRTNGAAVIPRHGNQEIATGTLHKILKELGLTLDDLQK